MSRSTRPLSPPPNLNDPNFQRWLWEFYQKTTAAQQITMGQLEAGTGTANQVLGVGTAGTSVEWKTPSAGTGLQVLLGSGTLNFFHGTSGVAAGTFGGAAGVPRFDLSALGHVAAGTNFPLVGSAPIAVTTGTSSFTFSHNTSGAAAGTYGGGTSVPQLTVDVYGHITNATGVPVTVDQAYILNRLTLRV